MLWQVDLSSEVPIYEQLAASVRREMAAGRLAKGDRLPSARDVAGSLAINLHTVLRAYQELREEGLIELRRGRGAVVLAANAKGEAHVRGLAHSLVSEARRLGLSRRDVLRIVEGELS
jgi:GntR family transcriptional regulator